MPSCKNAVLNAWRKLRFAFVIFIAAAPLVVSFINLFGAGFGYRLPIANDVRWFWLIAAYGVCFLACLYLGDASRSGVARDEFDRVASRAITRFAGIAAFGLAATLAIGTAIMAPDNLSPAACMPFSLLTFAGLMLGDLAGCPRILKC